MKESILGNNKTLEQKPELVRPEYGENKTPDAQCTTYFG